jgi:capsular exopolysaccharide synthesis family protein
MAVEGATIGMKQMDSSETKWWWPIKQKIWLILACVAIVVSCFAILPFVLDPLFDSHALVEVSSANVQREATNVSGIAEQRRVLMRTQQELVNGLASVEELRPYTYIELVPDTQLMAIHFQAPRADIARDGANTVAEAFVRQSDLRRDSEVAEAANRLAREIASINGATVFQVPEILDMRSAPVTGAEEPETLGLGNNQQGSSGLSALRSGALYASLNSQLEAGLVTQLLTSYEDAMSRVVHTRILNAAILPDESISRINALWVLTACMLAVALPAVYFVMRNQLRTSLDFESDVNRVLGYPCLGSLPACEAASMEEFAKDSQFRAAFSHVVADLRLQWPVPNALAQFSSGRVIMMSSARSGEGKTSVAINLAQTLSKSDSVLVINANMHASRKFLGIEPSVAGLSHLIAGAAQMRDCIHRAANYSIDVIPAGVLPPNPAELLSTPRFRQILATLRRRYETIILDAPSFSVCADGLLLAEHSDEAIYIVAKGSALAEEARDNLRNLEKRGVKVSGVIMNDCIRPVLLESASLRVAT